MIGCPVLMAIRERVDYSSYTLTNQNSYARLLEEIEMEKTKRLIEDLSTAKVHTMTIEHKIESLDHHLQNIHDDLNISKKMNRNLVDLDDALKEASELLSIVSIIPEIGAEAAEAKRIIDDFHGPVHKARKVSDRIEKKITPLRKGVKKTDEQVEKLVNAFLGIIRGENASIDKITKVQGCLTSLGDKKAFKDLELEMNSLSGTVDPQVVKVDQLQVSLISAIDGVEGKISGAFAVIKKFTDISNAVEHALSVLNPVIDSLKAIKSAFNQTISIPYPSVCITKGFLGVPIPYPCFEHFSFSIQQLLDGVHSILGPVMDLLNSAMNAVLGPLLKALHLDIHLPNIPYIGELESIFSSIERILEPIENEIKSLGDMFSECEKIFTNISGELKQLERIYENCKGS